MNRSKILGLALIAVFALGALTSATAFGAVELLNSKEAKKINSGFQVTGNDAAATAKLQILEGFAETKCPEVKIETETTSARLGTFHFHWKKCTTNIGGTCTGLGDESGLILALGSFHLVEDKLSSEGTLGAGILFLIEHVHYECKTILGTTLVLVTGEVLCLISPLTASNETQVTCEQGAKVGDPGETVYWNESGTKVEMGDNALLASENEGNLRMAAQVGGALGKNSVEAELMD